MKKKNLSFMTLFMLTATLIGGCSCNKQSNENVSKLVIKVGDKEYSASELYNELLSTGTGANEAFAKILRLVVESSMETTSNIRDAADLAAESFEEEVSNDALRNGTSKDDSRKKLLEEKGYTSVEQMKADIIYNQKLTRITENYWQENKDDYYESFVENRLPYLVRHVLVKIDDTNGNKIANNVSISQSDAKKLFDVIKRFENGDKFSYVANQESEDTGSIANGGAYYMDNTYGVNGFVDEFVYGTYAFDAYTTKNVVENVVSYTYGANQEKISKLKGLSDTATFSSYYENGFNFVDMGIVNYLGEVYNKTTSSNKDYFSIDAYDKVEGDGGVITTEIASGKNLNSSDNNYARSILFNRAFNKPGVSVIGYASKDAAEAAGAKNYVELKMSQTESKYILTDENSNPIFFVAARGSNNDIWVHFLTINVSSLDNLENAKKFFALGQDDTDDYVNYVELMNIAGTTQNANTLINELEGYVRSYATSGNGGTVGEESLLTYDMVKHYIEENNLEYLSNQLKNAVETYIANKKKFSNTKLINSMTEDWKTHTNKLASNMSEFVQRGIKPYECAVLVNDDVLTRDNPYTALSSNDHLCRYVYGEGYQVQLSYYYQTNSSSSSESFTKVSSSTNNRIYFDNESGYKDYVTIGSESAHIVLPTPKVSDGYDFQGWYTDKDFKHEVTYIDLSESRVTNHTIFFAKVKAITATNINYEYVYENGEPVENDVVIDNTNLDSKLYSATGGDNTISLNLASITSDYVTPIKFTNENGATITNIELTAQDYGETITVKVVVEPKATNMNYVYVDSQGNEVQTDVTNQNPTTVVYNPNGNNGVTMDLSKFVIDEANTSAKGVKFARNNVAFDQAENDFELAQTDMGKTITVYVIVGVDE